MNDIKELPELDLTKYRITPKFEEWRRLYLDKTNKETFGNATKSALIAYNLDWDKQYTAAGVIGHENLIKLNNLQLIVQEYLTDNGFNLPVLVAHALQKMSDPKVRTTHWWKEIMLLAGYIKTGPQIAIQNNTQNNFTQVQIDPAKAQEFKQEFSEFINNKYKGKPTSIPDSLQDGPE